jgi:hypothetical protein
MYFRCNGSRRGHFCVKKGYFSHFRTGGDVLMHVTTCVLGAKMPTLFNNILANIGTIHAWERGGPSAQIGSQIFFPENRLNGRDILSRWC